MIITTVYTADTIDPDHVQDHSELDFTTWPAYGYYGSTAEAFRVWQFIGFGYDGATFIATIKTLAREAGEKSVFVTQAESDVTRLLLYVREET